MTADASSEIRRVVWGLLIVTHLMGLCCVETLSVKDVSINDINCTYFDCDETSCTGEYDSDGIGCIDANVILTKDISDKIYAVIRTYQCILNECKTSLGLDVNGTLGNVISGNNVMSQFLKGLGMKLLEDCNCIHKGSYAMDHHCLNMEELMDQVLGQYLLILTMYDANNGIVIDLHIHVTT